MKDQCFAARGSGSAKGSGSMNGPPAMQGSESKGFSRHRGHRAASAREKRGRAPTVCHITRGRVEASSPARSNRCIRHGHAVARARARAAQRVTRTGSHRLPTPAGARPTLVGKCTCRGTPTTPAVRRPARAHTRWRISAARRARRARA